MGDSSSNALTSLRYKLFGFGASFGISLAIIRIAVHALKRYYLPSAVDGKRDKQKQYFTFLLRILLGNLLSINENDGRNQHGMLFESEFYMIALLKRIAGIEDDSEKRENCDEYLENRDVIHSGSCHCGSVHFELRAKAYFDALDSPGKIRYPHVAVESSAFRLIQGTRYLKMYYVKLSQVNAVEEEEDVTAAHAFCKRCGVPILRAPDSTKDCVEVNVNCINNMPVDSRSVCFRQDVSPNSLGAGIAIKDQWKNDKLQPDNDCGYSDSHDLAAAMAGSVLLGSQPSIPSTPSTQAINGSWMGRTLELDSTTSSGEASSVSSFVENSFGLTSSVGITAPKTHVTPESKEQFHTYMKRYLGGTGDRASEQLCAYMNGNGVGKTPTVPSLANGTRGVEFN
mmetsp:Transcript_12945/g.19382  ORF Transcript_12945/g.19382 Transcript_12945/m.19382 type:complete len:398 (-) Transcript_12945:101-1294(-)|eukprot:CAMPEP_0116021646 /NCGR_PEP_ID=MMETSP0321-20121206/10515_1 /TAXON_ID=163516 /ORGANISM="Leptocylindrus danicus var. danicus, Strain B650" /LENGTH=397 /DNA_ID=CAMNT_0003492565 /DNA_START=190 /DNA_END=1383 /DNA_ORIENTATION=-